MLKNRVLLTLFWLLWMSVVSAADLVIVPEIPVVERGKTIILSVSGTSGEIKWTAGKGQIQGTGHRVIYQAPAEAGLDVVTAQNESEGNFATVKVTVTKTKLISSENANWEVFSNRTWIQALALSEDKQTVWVGTNGGLEQLDVKTWERKRIFTISDGLPSNDIIALARDKHDRVWVGTHSGLAHLHADGSWEVFRTSDSDMPNNRATSLIVVSDGIWVGTFGGGLAHLDDKGNWKVFNTENSGLPDNYIRALAADKQRGGLWIGTQFGGLAYHHADGTWDVFNTDNSGLPHDEVRSLLDDGNGGVWIGTFEGGLAHLDAQGNWKVFNTENSDLSDNAVLSLFTDGSDGIWVGTWLGGLAHHHANGTWEIFNMTNSGLPPISVISIHDDGNNGVWVGTRYGGLAHRDANGIWTAFNQENSGPPDNKITSILADGKGGLWVGTKLGGLAHRHADGTWEVLMDDIKGLEWPSYITTTLFADELGGLWIGTKRGLAHLHADGSREFERNGYHVISLFADGFGGLWVGTKESGLAHRHADGTWEFFNTDNSDLPDNYVKSLLSDDKDGVWVGTYNGGLAHRHADGKWDIFDTDNSDLPNNRVNSLLDDSHGGIWVATGGFRVENPEAPYTGGLARLDADGEWEVFNIKNSELPDNWVNILLKDERGGIWIGTDGGGLAHLHADGAWTVININNPGLPENSVISILGDGRGGLWVGTRRGGLAHINFGQKSLLCTQISETECDALLTSKRAAIIIAGGGAHQENSLWDATEAVSNRVYQVLYKRGFDKSEIYYLSPKSWADFNGDGTNDLITKTPKQERLNEHDVRDALAWAENIGQLDQPLYLFFMDHGSPNKLGLDKGTDIKPDEFKAILDDYQNSTGNQLVLIIEACHSGSFMEALQAPNRAIISSAKAEEKAYFPDNRGFSSFFADGLLTGMNLWDAFGYAAIEQQQHLGNLEEATKGSESTAQTPQLDDNGDGRMVPSSDGQWLKTVYINGPFKTGDTTLVVESLTTSYSSLTTGQAMTLKAKASTNIGAVQRVWAVLRPPKMSFILDREGTPILAFPRLNMSLFKEENVWQTSWQDAVYNGDYEVTFYAKDKEGNIASSEESVIISVTGGIEAPAQANVQIQLEKDRYQRGESFKAELIENLGWGYDLYAAVVFPDGNYYTLKNTNEFAQANQPQKWVIQTQRVQNSPLTILDLTLPADLATGEYCLYGVLSPEKNSVLETVDSWVAVERCVEVF